MNIANTTRDFDKDAATWDEKPARVQLAASIAEAITQCVPLAKEMDILDFGCGTGLLAFNLAPHVRSVTGVDSSLGMLQVLAEKAAKGGFQNVTPLHCNLPEGGQLAGTYHLIASAMTLHHIQDLPPLLRQFHRALHVGGHLCLADLDPDAGLFHENTTGVFHQGFDRAFLGDLLRACGFANVKTVTAATVTKPAGENKSPRTFSVFLAHAEVRGNP